MGKLCLISVNTTFTPFYIKFGTVINGRGRFYMLDCSLSKVRYS